MACFAFIRLLKVRNNIIHKSLLILIRRLSINTLMQFKYRVLITEINPIDNTFGNLSRKRVIVKEHVERSSNS